MQTRRIVRARLLLFIMALLFLLVGFPNANVIASVPRASYDISSYAVIGYPEPFSGWEKTITWSDGIKETIEVTDKGAIKLNGTSHQAFGFDFFGWLNIPSTALDNVLDWQERNGVRFTETTYHMDRVQNTKNRMDSYMPKFYDHKMFVSLTLRIRASLDPFDQTNINNWKTGFDEIIDYIDANGWSDLVFAIQVSHEMARFADIYGKTLQEMSETLDDLHNHASTKLSTSQIGSVPITHQAVIWANPTETFPYRDYWKKILEKTDIIMITFYPKNLDRMDANLVEIRDLASQVGKDPSNGYKIWHEFGRHIELTKPTYVPADHFTHLLDQSDAAYVFLFFVYEDWDDSPEIPTWYFDLDGIAESWTENLAPYFP